ncbi:MAG: hypothetical protein QOH59_1269, partial [Gemmatimonadales bacterium]|nr:hypothetical protein [Gemmatimonadales bacterium]
MSRAVRQFLTAIGLASVGCGDGTGPGEGDIPHDRILFAAQSGIGVIAPDGSDRRIISTGS